MTDNDKQASYDPNHLFDLLIKKLNIRNDAALSRLLQVAPPVLSKIRNHHMPVGPSLLIRMHELSGLGIQELRTLMGDRHAPLRADLNRLEQDTKSADVNEIESSSESPIQSRYTLSAKVIDALMTNYTTQETLIDQINHLTKALTALALKAETTKHGGYRKNARVTSANVYSHISSRKSVWEYLDFLPIEIPNDHRDTSESQITTQNRASGGDVDRKILSLYIRGMTARGIQSHLHQLYGIEVSTAMISSITDAVKQEAIAWQSRPLKALYPIVYLDCIQVNVHDGETFRCQVLYLLAGLDLDGMKEVLGLWMTKTEDTAFWCDVVTDMKNRGVADIFIACSNGVKGFSTAMEQMFPETSMQLSIVHMVRHSLNFANLKQREEISDSLRRIYTAQTIDEARRLLDTFEEKWKATHAPIGDIWRRSWNSLVPFFACPADIRKVLCTTNAIESINMRLRKVTKTHGPFLGEEAVLNLFSLVLINIAQKWTLPIRDWKAALNRFTTQFENRIPPR